ncbi:MAG: radical SAM protein [Patescibacteria group bacterium]
MAQKFRMTVPAIRLKITGKCNRSCSFCHQEGDMKRIEDVVVNEAFFNCIETLSNTLGVSRIMITGGEPTLHPQLKEIISSVKANEVSLTTNGIKLYSIKQWQNFKKAGLNKATISINDVSPERFLELETRKRHWEWAEKSLNNQLQNIINLGIAEIPVRVNVIVYSNYISICEVIEKLKFLQRVNYFEIRLLNNLNQIEISQEIISKVRKTLEVKEIQIYQRSGSSSVTRYYRAKDGFEFSTKIAFPYFFTQICDDCSIKQNCLEGFYGVRIEKIKEEYFVRLCLYKQSSDVLMPWKVFVDTGLAKKVKTISAKK